MKSRSASRLVWKALSCSTLPFLCSKVFSLPTQTTRLFLPTKVPLSHPWVDISMFQASDECCAPPVCLPFLCMYSRNCGTWQRSLSGKLDQLPCKMKSILGLTFPGFNRVSLKFRHSRNIPRTSTLLPISRLRLVRLDLSSKE